MARAVGNRYQEVRLRFIEATAVRDLGETERAATLVRDAIDDGAGREHGQPGSERPDRSRQHLSCAATIRVAPSRCSGARSTSPAAAKVRRIEARATGRWARCCEKDHGRRSEAARRGRADVLSAGRLRARIRAGGHPPRRRAASTGSERGWDPDPARHTARRRKTPRSPAGGSTPRAHCREPSRSRRLAGGDRGYTRTGELYGAISQGEEARVQAAELEWRVGRSEEALRLLRGRRSSRLEGKDKGLLFSITFAQAEIAYAQGRFGDARALARKALATTDSDSPSSRPLTLLTALTRIRLQRDAEGLPSATRVVDEFEQAGLASDAAFARLAIAEALAAGGQRGQSATYVREALNYFEPKRVWEAALRGRMVAARVSQAELKSTPIGRARVQRWRRCSQPGERTAVEAYLTRPDIRQLSRGTNFQP